MSLFWRTIAHLALRLEGGLAVRGLLVRAESDKVMILDHLAQAERHVSQGLRHVARQKRIIVDLTNGGHDTAMARSLLVNFEDVLEMHIADRDRLKKELADGP